MFDCATDILAYHDSEVTLPQTERDAMRDRRDSNRDRLENGLESNENPLPEEYCSQGSYSMKTMTQHPDNDYDIDDGAYFSKEDLIGPRGGEMSAPRSSPDGPRRPRRRVLQYATEITHKLCSSSIRGGLSG